jgi:predicted kinase
MNLVIIAGMPASGKSTVATELSQMLNLPIIEKDHIKEELFDTLGFNNYAQKRSMDVAATAVLLRVADDLLSCGQSLIMVNNFRDDAKEAVQHLIDKHRLKCVLVFFGGDSDVFYQRYVERDNKHLRHLGHVLQDRYPPLPGDSLDYEMTRDEFAMKFESLGMTSLDVTAERIDIDATHPETINVRALADQITRLLEQA